MIRPIFYQTNYFKPRVVCTQKFTIQIGYMHTLTLMLRFLRDVFENIFFINIDWETTLRLI